LDTGTAWRRRMVVAGILAAGAGFGALSGSTSASAAPPPAAGRVPAPARLPAASPPVAGQELHAGQHPASTARAATADAPVAIRAVLARPADAPLNVSDQITDRAGVLANDAESLRGVLADLRSQQGLQLFVVYVDSFDGASGETWAQQTFTESGMGGDDVLLAVAVKDRRYGTYTTGDSGLTPQQDNAVRSHYIEPRLAADDWAGAVRAAAEGYGKAKTGDLDASNGQPQGGDRGDGTSGGGGGLSPWWLLVPAGGVALWAFKRRGKSTGGGPGRGGASGPQGQPPASTEELQKRAAAALIEVDDAIRSSAEELTFAEAQFGVQATQRFRDALTDAKSKAAEAFRVQREIDDLQSAQHLDDYGHRQRLERIIELASAADKSLDEQEAEFARLRNLQATVPQFLGELRGRLDEVRRRIPVAQQELTGLGAQYPPATLETVADNVEQAQRLITSAEGFLEQGEQHLAHGDDRPAAVAAARAAEDAIGQADQLLTSVSGARDELAHAATRLDAALASISSDIADAERLHAEDQLTQTALTAARAAIAAGTAAGTSGDPLAALRALRRAEQDLDNALARYRAEEEHAIRTRQLFDQRLAQVRARLASIDDLISSRRGAVGSGPRTHIANAHHLCEQAAASAAADPVQGAALLDQAEQEGEAALRLAQRDIDSWGGLGGGPPGTVRGPRGLDPTSLILGGILSGGFGGRGGGWGGSQGGFGGGIGGGGFGGGGRF
jgi:uncharacterized membrane protein YgcG